MAQENDPRHMATNIHILSSGRSDTEWKQANPWCAENYFTVVSHPFWIVMHFTDTDGTVYIRDTYLNTVLVYND